MENRKYKRVVHTEIERWDLPGNLLEFQDWLANQIESIPEECINSAEIEFIDGNDYVSTSLSIEYQRLETQEEADARAELTAARQDRALEEQRAQFLLLKAKFEPEGG